MSDCNDPEISSETANENEDSLLLNDEGNEETGLDEEASMVDDSDLEAIRARIKEMEEEGEKIRQMQTEVEKQMNVSNTSSSGGNASGPANISFEEKLEMDNRSIYVGNVDYGATAEELEAHFHGCGSINRVTIQCDKFSGTPKGFAYIEFVDKESVQTALALDDSLFRGRQIKVSMKRTNKPGISSTNRPPRGRGGGRTRVIIKYIYPGARRGRGMYPLRRRNFYSPY